MLIGENLDICRNFGYIRQLEKKKVEKKKVEKKKDFE